MVANNLEFDTREIAALSIELGVLGARTPGPVKDAFDKGSVELRDEWRKRAKLSSGRHARKYPGTILVRSYNSQVLNYEIGPLRSARGRGLQGDLGVILEFGVKSKNTSPSLDGQHAADVVFPRIERAVLDAAAGLFNA